MNSRAMEIQNDSCGFGLSINYIILSFFFSRAVFGEFYTELIENHVLFKTPEEEAKAAQVSREG